MTMDIMLSRRDLLKAGGALIVTFGFEAALPRSARAQTSLLATGKPLDPTEVDSFLAIHSDGAVTVYTGKVDVGTGFRIAVAQMAGEELGVPAQRITIVDGDTARCPDQGGTGGSTGLTRGGADVRQAAAAARQALLALAPRKLNRAPGELTNSHRGVRPPARPRGADPSPLPQPRRPSS